jgi:hypothetical protein
MNKYNHVITSGSRRIRWAGNVARIGETRNACRILVENSERKRPLRRLRRRWVNNIKTNLREKGWGWRVDWINLAQDSDQWRVLVNTVKNLRVP